MQVKLSTFIEMLSKQAGVDLPPPQPPPAAEVLFLSDGVLVSDLKKQEDKHKEEREDNRKSDFIWPKTQFEPVIGVFNSWKDYTPRAYPDGIDLAEINRRREQDGRLLPIPTNVSAHSHPDNPGSAVHSTDTYASKFTEGIDASVSYNHAAFIEEIRKISPAAKRHHGLEDMTEEDLLEHRREGWGHEINHANNWFTQAGFDYISNLQKYGRGFSLNTYAGEKPMEGLQAIVAHKRAMSARGVDLNNTEELEQSLNELRKVEIGSKEYKYLTAGQKRLRNYLRISASEATEDDKDGNNVIKGIAEVYGDLLPLLVRNERLAEHQVDMSKMARELNERPFPGLSKVGSLGLAGLRKSYASNTPTLTKLASLSPGFRQLMQERERLQRAGHILKSLLARH